MIVSAVLALFLGSAVLSEPPCPPCHCEQGGLEGGEQWGVLDCSRRRLPDLHIESWNVSGYSSLSLDGSVFDTLLVLPPLPGIASLSLRYNNLTRIASAAFVHLEDLKTLDLSHNKLTADALRPDVLRGPWRADSYEPLGLEVLILRHNALHALGRRSLEHLPALRELRLDGNPLDVLDQGTQAAVSGATKLQVLGLSGCGLRSLPADFLPPPPHGPPLSSLDLSWNALASVPDSLPASLERLSLDGNPLLGLQPSTAFAPPFVHLSSLRELSLSFLPLLERVPPGAFFGLHALRALSCTDNPRLREVDASAFSHLGPSRSLTEVSLRNNSLSWIPPGLFAWHSLTFLDLTDNPWHCSCNFTRWAARVLRPINLAKGSYRCATPARLSSRDLWTAWNSTEPCPEDRVAASLVAGSLLAALTLLVLLLIAILTAHCLRAHARRVSARQQLGPHRHIRYAPAPLQAEVPDVALPTVSSGVFWTGAASPE